MRSVVLYFQVHQPFRLRKYTFFDVGASDAYFDDEANRAVIRRVAEKCYLPMTRLLLRAIEETGGRFRCAISISGPALDQLERWAPEALEGFRRLAETECVEFLAETSHHSLASQFDLAEFDRQVLRQADRVEALFGARPTTFRNTELICSNDLARHVERLGYSCILGEGADRILGWRSPNRVYRPETCGSIRLLLRSYRLSDDIAFRFTNRGWSEWPLRAGRFADWLEALPEGDTHAGLFMDFETFGEHQWADSGIFEFMARLPREVLSRPGLDFARPAEVAARHDPVARLDMPDPVSWADEGRDLSAWLGNHMQRAANEALYDVGRRVLLHGDPALVERWRKLSTSDHLYYMCTKWFSDGDVHKYFSPFATPHDGFIVFMNVLDDLARRAAIGAPRRLAPTEKDPVPAAAHRPVPRRRRPATTAALSLAKIPS
jgi:alpha-amylase